MSGHRKHRSLWHYRQWLIVLTNASGLRADRQRRRPTQVIDQCIQIGDICCAILVDLIFACATRKRNT